MSQDRRPAGRARGRGARALAAAALSLTLLGSAAGCGFDAQTLQPYTPADGTNLDVGADNQLKIRNLVVVSRTEGQGIISASVLSGADDTLTGVAVVPSPLSGSPGPAPTIPVSYSAATASVRGRSRMVATTRCLVCSSDNPAGAKVCQVCGASCKGIFSCSLL